MNRTDFQILAEARVADAHVLLDGQRWAAAYYLLGYAVECALKAVIARQFRDDEVPQKKLVNDFYTHRLDALVVTAKLEQALDERRSSDPLFQKNWTTVLDWSEASRYEHSRLEADARTMLAAVADEAAGVLSWLKTQW